MSRWRHECVCKKGWERESKDQELVYSCARLRRLIKFRSQVNVVNFKEVLTEVVREGGDADTNGAVCGAVLGARLGYSRLPMDWANALPYRAWLDNKILRFLGAAHPDLVGP